MLRLLGFLIGLGTIAHYVVIGIGGGAGTTVDGLGKRYTSALFHFLEGTLSLDKDFASRIVFGGPGVIAGIVCILLAVRGRPSS